MKLDFIQGQRNPELLKWHLERYDEVAEKTLSSFSHEVFRARMYFGKLAPYKELQGITKDISEADGRIVWLLTHQDGQPQPENRDLVEKWKVESEKLQNLIVNAEKILYTLNQQVDIDLK